MRASAPTNDSSSATASGSCSAMSCCTPAKIAISLASSRSRADVRQWPDSTARRRPALPWTIPYPHAAVPGSMPRTFTPRAAKNFRFGERMALSAYIDLYNVFNVENLSYASRLALSPATAAGSFLQPVSLYGPGFGPPVGRPLTAQLGLRFTF